MIKWYLRVVILGGALLLGCEDKEVRRYKVAKAHPKKVRPREGSGSAMPKASAATSRMFAAIFLRPDRTWFFKLMGPQRDLAPLTEPFRTFVRSVRFGGTAPLKEVSWDLPATWEAKPKSGMRYATIKIPSQGKPLDLTVIPLGKAASDILSNVNRWRGQVGLGAIDAAGLGQCTERLTVGETEVVIVDIAKTAPDSGSAPPVMGQPSSGGSKHLAYRVPTGWQEDPSPKSMRAASFQIKDGGQSAEVTVIPLPGPAGGLLNNVNRWRRQISLPPTTQAELDATRRMVPVGELKGDYVDLMGPDSKGDQRERTLGVGVLHGGKTWFFKMKGSPALIERHKKNFEAFLKSVQFEGGKGGAR